MFSLFVQEVCELTRYSKVLISGPGNDADELTKLSSKYSFLEYSESIPDNDSKYDAIIADYYGKPPYFSKDDLSSIKKALAGGANDLVILSIDNPLKEFLSNNTYSTTKPTVDEIISELKELGHEKVNVFYSMGNSHGFNAFTIDSIKKGALIKWNHDSSRLYVKTPSLLEPASGSLYAGKEPVLYSLFCDRVIIIASKNSTSNSLLYFRSSASRKKNFSIYTSVYEEFKSNIVYAKKVAQSESAREHISHIVKNKSALKSLKGSLDSVNVLQVSEDEVRFPFVAGENLYTKLSQSLIGGDYRGFYAEIDGYLTMFNSFTLRESNPCDNVNYTSIFGRTYDENTLCISPGLIDFNFDNIIITDKKATIIDYEWLFEFPIPRTYIITRALYYFFFDHQQYILRAAKHGLATAQISKQVHIPKVIYERYSEYFTDIDNFLSAEKGFQKYVLRNNKTGNDDAYFEESSITSPQPLLKDYLDQMSGALRKLELENKALNARLNQILTSKRWLVATRLSRAFNFFKWRQ